MKLRIPVVTTILYVGLILIALAITVGLYWLYSPPKEALSVSPHPIPVVNKVIKRDNTCAALGFDRCVILKLTRCKHVKTEGRVVITLVGQTERIPLPIAFDRSDRDCQTDVTLPLPIPNSALPGKYSYHFTATFKVNPLTSITQEYDTETFEVKE